MNIECHVCNREMPGARSGAKYCTKKCRSLGQRKPGQHGLSYYQRIRKELHLPILFAERVPLGDLILRDGFDCQICHQTMCVDDMEMDHIIPVSDPRCTHEADNLRAVHKMCNSIRGNDRDFFSL